MHRPHKMIVSVYIICDIFFEAPFFGDWNTRQLVSKLHLNILTSLRLISTSILQIAICIIDIYVSAAIVDRETISV